ncbi:hypothetical protein CSIM01_02660 [Colletotrichum simmondsii]|uniref:Uncharacterized protein n=1 Tax=Colletotrichum simmondsii TaxID=703756 RepID=A0A135RUK6_9PEZI|nr:hypothetical protein CSIM01_02660 [Colletotrichum simmondsii]
MRAEHDAEMKRLQAENDAEMKRLQGQHDILAGVAKVGTEKAYTSDLQSSQSAPLRPARLKKKATFDLAPPEWSAVTFHPTGLTTALRLESGHRGRDKVDGPRHTHRLDCVLPVG